MSAAGTAKAAELVAPALHLIADSTWDLFVAKPLLGGLSARYSGGLRPRRELSPFRALALGNLFLTAALMLSVQPGPLEALVCVPAACSVPVGILSMLLSGQANKTFSDSSLICSIHRLQAPSVPHLHFLPCSSGGDLGRGSLSKNWLLEQVSNCKDADLPLVALFGMR